MSESYEGRIVTLEVELRGLREQQKAHAQSLKDEIKDLRSDIRALTEIMNKGKGAFAFGLMLAGTIGAGAVKILSYIFHPGPSQ